MSMTATERIGRRRSRARRVRWIGIGVGLALLPVLLSGDGYGMPRSEVAGVSIVRESFTAIGDGMPLVDVFPAKWWRREPKPRPAPVIGTERAVELDIFNAINIKRGERRLPPLAWDEGIAEVARLHSRYLADNNKLDHRGRGGSQLKDRIKDLSWIEAGENLARNINFPDPVAQAVAGWIKSPGHAKNLYSPTYRLTGVGVVRKPDGFYYFTQVFTRPPDP